ncbi:hypothetical protein RBWH47_05924 [Rhodopirellula baltica WH47]|uniref:Uncharacterized protein n=1 Tax=Rhodopirellula baltica WH47 TaxID=991778 RepID=F2AWA0_RHOBT|nr:hypothetical protein RBWH47_05924 [Rhodopirellula baltica WH47]
MSVCPSATENPATPGANTDRPKRFRPLNMQLGFVTKSQLDFISSTLVKSATTIAL